MLIPYSVDVPMNRWPVTNGLIIAGTVVVSSYAMGGYDLEPWAYEMILEGAQLKGLLGHALLHAGFMHLLGNMLFLFVFGNAVCAKLGNVIFLPVYLLLVVAAGLTHVVFDGGTAIGASGAVNGIVGMFFVLYPLNAVNTFWFFFFRGGTFAISSFWIILYWLAFDLWGAMSGGGGIAYWAHIGGFAAGALLAVALLKLGWIKMDRSEKSIIDVARNDDWFMLGRMH